MEILLYMINLKNPKNKASFYLLYLINFVKGTLFTIRNSEYLHEGISIRYPKKLFGIADRAAFFDKNYEFEEHYLVKKYLNDTDSVLELGGCLGFVSCLINKKLTNKSNHVVLEPNPYLQDYLQFNRNNNGCDFRIIEGVLSKRKKEELFFNNTILGSSIKNKTDRSVFVSCFTINQLQEKFNLKFNTMVIDIEGGEYNLFKETDFKNLNISKIIIEFHNFSNILADAEIDFCREKLNENNFKHIESLNNTHVFIK